MDNKKLVLATMLATSLLLSACGSKEEAASEPKEEEKKTEEVKNEKDSSNEEEKEIEKEEPKKDENEKEISDNEVFNPTIGEETEGNVEVIYTNPSANFIHDLDGFKIAVDKYQIVKVSDINEATKSYFDDQIEGYVVTANVTIENGTDKQMYFNNVHKIQMTSDFDYISARTNYFIAEDKQISNNKKSETVSLYEPGEKVSGLLTFVFTNEEYETLKTVKPKYIIEGGLADNPEFKGSNGAESPAYDFIYSDEQAKEVSEQPNFYQDRLTTDNMADKKMIFEKLDINDTQQIDKVNITLEGVQYTEVLPTEANKERFVNFGDNGIVALTVKLKIDNQSDIPLNLSSLGTILSVDDNRARVLSQGMVEPSDPREIVAGAQGEKLHVFLFRKDEFGIYKKFTMEFGPFKLENGQDAFKGRKLTFELPR
ncbi:DUF5068 domain-containing protein [Metabacillus malikii]|uniref:DUF5068 domain-containing protein n=1 Tax=Metabacillus malikii TaxID=1504265 RepID=A0ABT9ZBR4_9BACI|nr:DUF5068 domain-containing protein [Metabacillus malikii]MDQ0229667.1 hypothetical protein [Metabacillus malikii]